MRIRTVFKDGWPWDAKYEEHAGQHANKLRLGLNSVKMRMWILSHFWHHMLYTVQLEDIINYLIEYRPIFVIVVFFLKKPQKDRLIAV